MHNGGRTKMASTSSTLAIPANTSGTFLVGFIFDFVKERQSDLMESQLMTSNNDASLNIVSRIDIDAEQTDAELMAHLLMPVWAYQSAAVYLIFISVLGLFMNIVVILVIVNDPQKMTSLNWMLLNLACSDGLIAGFGTPISAAAALQYNWPFSDELCVAYAMIMSTAGIGSITTLTALALWRCQLVVYCPAKRSGAFANHHSGGGGGGSAKLGRVQAAVLLTLIWAYSLAVTCPPLFGWGRYDREAAHISCSVNWESKMANNRSYILYMFAFGLFVPFLVIICSYVSILRVVKQTGKFKRTMMATLQPTPQHQISDHQANPTAKKMEQKKGNDAAEKRVTVMVACMVGAFMAAWTPYSILALFETFIGVAGHSGGPGRNMSNTTFSLDGQQQFNDNQPTNEADDSHFFYYYVGTISPAFATIPSLFAKTSAVLNPLIYGLLNTQFRSAWEKFTTRFLGRRCLYQHSSNRNKFSRNFLNCADGGRGSPSLKQSITVHLSMKEIVSSESQSAYVMASTVGGQPGITLLLHKENQDVMDMRAQQHHIHSPSLTSSSCSMADPESSVSIRMKSLKNPVRHPNQQEEHQLDHHKLVVVRLVSDSTSCSCINDDHLLPQQSTEESAF
ncbi:melanopsin-like [Daphnia pulex]|uniref:melanopsin-like n=1 Tax=Daphnia pulex TaxID=6669 RepID=UPI001EDFF6F5|nr:melanopsin-like [Daphnia pulex]